MSEGRCLGLVQPVSNNSSAHSEVSPAIMEEFVREMRIAKRSERTIEDRVALVERLRLFLAPKPLMEATESDLRRFQATFSHCAPATVEIYTRNMQIFFKWALKRRYILTDPAEDLPRPRVVKRRPHPMAPAELKVILGSAPPNLRKAYVLGSFAGLRCGEICRFQGADIDYTGSLPSALIHGKGGRERTVPLLEPVMEELREMGLPRRGYIVTKNGRPYTPLRLSVDSHYFLESIGIPTTLHSCRHFFCTFAARMTKDPVFVKELAGHASVDTTMLYVESDMSGAHKRLSEFAQMASEMLGHGPTGLRLVKEEGS